MVFYCSGFQLKGLTDIWPEIRPHYIRSTTEPFDDEMEIREGRVVNWFVHFGLVSKKGQLSRSHVSGHGDGTQIKKITEDAKSKKLIPIHTGKEKYRRMCVASKCKDSKDEWFFGTAVELKSRLAKLSYSNRDQSKIYCHSEK